MKYPAPTPTWQYLEMDAAKFWSLTPAEYDAREPDEKARMMAFAHVQRDIEQYHYDQSMKAAKAKAESEGKGR